MRVVVAVAQEQAKVKELFKQKDVDASGGLNADQMKDFMQDYIKTTSGNAEKIVSDAEVKCVSSTSHPHALHRASTARAHSRFSAPLVHGRCTGM